MDGPTLKELRQSAGYKGAEISRKLGLCPQTWSRYENGHSPIPKTVEYATRFLCQPRPATLSAIDRLTSAIKEIANGTER